MRDERTYQRGHDWLGEDVAGYYASRKLNGVCLLWDGADGWTRTGNRIELPPSIRATLPQGMPLDCELVHGGGRNADFKLARAAVQFNRWTPLIHAVVFDAPKAAGDWLQRLRVALDAGAPCVSVAVIRDNADLVALFQQVADADGEGLILRKPGSRYHAGRTRDVFKVKWSAEIYSHMEFQPYCADSVVNTRRAA